MRQIIGLEGYLYASWKIGVIMSDYIVISHTFNMRLGTFRTLKKGVSLKKDLHFWYKEPAILTVAVSLKK